MSRRLAVLLLAVVAATGLLAVPAGTAEVRAATPDLTLVSDARYVVQPAKGRVRVTVDLLLTNRLQDTTTQRFYFDRAFLSVMPGASGFKLSWAGGGSPGASVSRTTATYTVVELRLAERLYGGKSASYRFTFDLADPGGEPTRDIRVGDSLVAFPVWAYASDSTPGSTVRVEFPAGYRVEIQAGKIAEPTTAPDGTTTLQTAALPKPLTFFAYLVADRPASYVERSLTTTVGDTPVDLTVRGWADDKPWSKRVGDLVARALPALSEAIGLGWPRDEGLIIHETVTRTTGGYAGLFDPKLGQIEVAYDAGDSVVLHELAHAWFNGTLLADRWSSEAFASYYGLEIAKGVGVKAEGDPITAELEKARIPLNAWGAIGTEPPETEDYAYAATLAVAREIAERAGPDGLRAVWADAAAGIWAYQPPTDPDGAGSGVGGDEVEPEAGAGPPDWRGLLDLFEANTTGTYDDLWRTWIARDSDLPLLDARQATRATYETVVAEAGAWQLPVTVRDAMRAWRFDQAGALLRNAATILDQRAAILAAAASSGLTVPDTLQAAFEASDGFASATLEAQAELEAIERYDAAAASRLADPDMVEAVGLWGTAPEVDLDLARTLFAAGDLGGSATAADAAASAWTSAPDVGRGRIVSLIVLGVALLMALVLLGVLAARPPTRRHGHHRGDGHRRHGLVRYTRRLVEPDRTGRGQRRSPQRSGTGLMGLSRSRPSHEILSGDSADVYFARAETILAEEGRDPLVTMEVFTRQAAVLCGIDEARNLLGHVLASADPSETRLEALADGDRIEPREIVLRIQARYRKFGLYETAFLGMLAQSTGWATAARTVVDVAAPDPVISFGARHIHPDITDVLDYAAIVGGCVGASTPAGARLAGLAPTGTMPHSLVLIFGDTVEASLAFDRHMPPDVPRIVLVDTFKDEAEEALRVAHALGDRLYGIRLDTPSERGRVTADLVHEVRARLDQAGFGHVRITVSGGLNPDRIQYFKDASAPVDSYAVGSFISGATPIDFTGDIKVIDGQPIAKRGRIPGLTDSPRLQPVDLASYRDQ